MFQSHIIFRIIKLLEIEKGKSGLFFSAINTTKDGSLRVWNCRLDVKKYTSGGKLKFNPEEKNLLMVYSRKRQAYRSIKCNTLQYLKVCGVILIKDGQPTDAYDKWVGPARAWDRLKKSA